MASLFRLEGGTASSLSDALRFLVGDEGEGSDSAADERYLPWISAALKSSLSA